MPSMRLNTQANAGLADPTEWQTVSAKAKVKTKTKSEEDGQAPVAAQHNTAIANGTGRTGTANASIVASRPAAVASRQYQPEELGFEVLAAYDQAWAASIAPAANKNGKQAKTPAAPSLPEPAFTAVPAPQEQPAQEAKESKSAKAKKKAKAKQNAAASAAAAPENTPAPANGAANGKQNGQPNGSTAAKKQPAAKKSTDAPNTAKPTITASRSMPKSAATVASASAEVDLSELAEHVTTSRSKHSKDGVLQLQLLASWLARTFSGVHYHLGVMIEKSGVSAAISQPWGEAVEPLQKALLTHTGEVHADDVARYVLRVCEQTIAALPEKGGAQSDVGELLVLSAACRACPLAIALASPGLCPLRSKILSPGRIPITLWLLGQAASAGGEGAACAIHAWSRVVLPCITYQEVTLATKPAKKAGGKGATKPAKPVSVYHIEPAARDAALDFLKESLLADKTSVHRSALKKVARAGLPVGQDGAGAAVVPASAVAAAEAAASGAVATARGTADAVAAVKGDLSDLCDACRNPQVVAAAVGRALAAAEIAVNAEDAAALLPATKAMIVQLSRHGDIAGDAWGKEHRSKLAGSTAILEQLAADTTLVQPVLNAPLGNDTLLNAIDGIEKAHASILSSGKDTPAKELAQRAERAARSLSYASISVIPASAKWSIASILVILAVTIGLSVNMPDRVEAALEPVIGASRATLVTSTCQNGVENVKWFVGTMWDAWTGNDERTSVFGSHF